MGLELVIDESVVLDFMTYDAAGLPADADSLPTIEIYEDATDAAIAYAPTVVSRSLDGHYRVTIAPTGANGFTAGNAYHVYVLATIATDDYKTKLDWAVARAFSIDSLKDAIDALIGTPVTDVSTDIAAIKTQTDLIPADPATETTLAAIQAQTDLIPADPATETTVGNVPSLVWEELSASHVTADTMGELLNGAGNPWSILTTGNVDAGTFGEAVVAIQAQTDLLPADPATETTLAAIKAQTDLIPADPATETTVSGVPAAVWEELSASHVTAATMGEALNLADDIKAQTDLIPADPATETTLAAIQGQTDLIPADPATETTVGNVPSLVWEELSAAHVTADTMGELLNGAGNPWSILVTGNTDAGSFGEAVDAIKVQTDLIPADPATETTLATIPGAVWEEASASHVSAGTMGEALSLIKGQTDLIPADPATETTLATIQSQTDLIPADPATETTLAAIKAKTDLLPADPATVTKQDAILAAVDVVDNFLDTEIAAIKAKTDNLPADPADASDIATAFSGVNTKIDTIDDFLDTEVAAIKAKTDLIPADPATVTKQDAILAAVDAVDNFVDTEVTAIKAKTDNLPSDPADASDIAAAIAAVSAFVDTEVAAIKAKTDLIPADPATVTKQDAILAAVDTVDNFLDTEIAAIKAKTDNLPSDPADASDVATAFSTLSGKVDVIDNFLDTEIAAIKAKTDNLPADPAAAADITSAVSSIDASLGDVPGLVWDEVSDDHVTSNTTGKKLYDSGLASNPWSAQTADNADAGTFGELLGVSLPAEFETISDDLQTVIDAVPTGDGTIAVDHDSGGDDNLTYKTTAGAGIDNAVVQAILKDDYDAGRRSAAYVAGESITNVHGQWTKPMKLDVGEYAFIFYKQGVSGPDRKDYTVS